MADLYKIFTTTQNAPASRLVEIVQKHAQTIYRKPIADHQVQAFQLVRNFMTKHNKPVIIDSGCGTGMSSALLAELYPNHVVIGFDKSEARLSRMALIRPPNCIVLRADAIDLWRLLSQQCWPIAQHYIFFPNPWPKASHIKRRFHAHPIFSLMARLAPYFELRTNWRIYAEECALAFQALGHKVSVHEKTDRSYMTLFEKKYQESGCVIYIVKSERPVQDTYC